MPCESRFEDDGRKIVNFESTLPNFVNFESLIVNFESRGASAMVTFGSYSFAQKLSKLSLRSKLPLRSDECYTGGKWKM